VLLVSDGLLYIAGVRFVVEPARLTTLEGTANS